MATLRVLVRWGERLFDVVFPSFCIGLGVGFVCAVCHTLYVGLVTHGMLDLNWDLGIALLVMIIAIIVRVLQLKRLNAYRRQA